MFQLAATPTATPPFLFRGRCRAPLPLCLASPFFLVNPENSFWREKAPPAEHFLPYIFWIRMNIAGKNVLLLWLSAVVQRCLLSVAHINARAVLSVAYLHSLLLSFLDALWKLGNWQKGYVCHRILQSSDGSPTGLHFGCIVAKPEQVIMLY